MTEDVLAFDVGQNIVGVLDLVTERYTPYRGSCKIDGARRVIECEGTIVSFNGCEYDLPKLIKLLKDSGSGNVGIRGTHCDMREIASADRWPPDPGKKPIWGTNLMTQYEHYCGSTLPEPPDGLRDDYEEDNWRDCYMAGRLWMKLCLEREA